jgi:hypothetical protein
MDHAFNTHLKRTQMEKAPAGQHKQQQTSPVMSTQLGECTRSITRASCCPPPARMQQHPMQPLGLSCLVGAHPFPHVRVAATRLTLGSPRLPYGYSGRGPAKRPSTARHAKVAADNSMQANMQASHTNTHAQRQGWCRRWGSFVSCPGHNKLHPPTHLVWHLTAGMKQAHRRPNWMRRCCL